jgi:hypothetical protein
MTPITRILVRSEFNQLIDIIELDCNQYEAAPLFKVRWPATYRNCDCRMQSGYVVNGESFFSYPSASRF